MSGPYSPYYTSWADSPATSSPIVAAALNNIENGLVAASGAYNVKAVAFGATGNGTTNDTAAIQAAITAASSAGGGVVFLPAGTYLLNSSPLTVTTSGVRITGAGQGATVLVIGSSFSGAAAINVTGSSDVLIAGLQVKGASTTYSSNPAADAIRFNNSSRATVTDCLMQYVNGYAVSSLGNATSDSWWTNLTRVHSVQCAQGAHILGNTASGYGVGAVIDGCNFENTQAGDGVLLEDVHDVQITNLEAWNAAGSSGSTLHVKGNTAGVYVYGPDLGGFTGTTPQAQPVVLVESGTNGTPKQVSIIGGIIEAGTPGLSVTAGTEILACGVNFFQNANYGVSVTGGEVLLTGCTFNGNGYTAASANYDAVIGASASAVRMESCEFLTPAGTSSQQVASAVNANGPAYIQHCRFAGAGAFGGGGGGYAKLARNNLGYNPIGSVTAPGVPATTVALTNPFGTDCTVIISGGTVSAIAIGGTATGLTSGVLRLPWNQSITLTYTAAPTWKWFAE